MNLQQRLFAAPLALALLLVTPLLYAQAVPAGTEYIPYGGHQELGILSGYSWHAGPALGYVRNTTYGVTVLRYSYKIHTGKYYDLRYAPEVTLFATLYEPGGPNTVNPQAPIRHYSYPGISPIDLEMVFLPTRRIQPLIMIDGGQLYYNGPVLSPTGSNFMFTVDYGAGAHFFLNARNAIDFQFRYEHQSNADSAQHNPGADAELFYLGFSHFMTRGKH